MVWTTSIETERVLYINHPWVCSAGWSSCSPAQPRPSAGGTFSLLRYSSWRACSAPHIEFFHPKLLTKVKVWKTCDKRCLASHESPNDRNHIARSVADKQGWSPPAPGHARIIIKNEQIKEFLIPSCVREGYQSFPSKLLNTVKVSLFWDNHSSVFKARALSTDLSQGLICRSGSPPSSGDRCPLDKRCLDKNPSASTSSEVFREVNTPSMSLLLYESLIGFLVVVVWWDEVEATLMPVQYQTKLNNHIRMELNLSLALTGT